MVNATLRGKPVAGNPHVRFDEGEVAPAKPRRGSLRYKKIIACAGVVAAAWLTVGAATLPDGYTELEYVESTLADKQYVNTAFYPRLSRFFHLPDPPIRLEPQ